MLKVEMAILADVEYISVGLFRFKTRGSIVKKRRTEDLKACIPPKPDRLP